MLLEERKEIHLQLLYMGEDMSIHSPNRSINMLLLLTDICIYNLVANGGGRQQLKADMDDLNIVLDDTDCQP